MNQKVITKYFPIIQNHYPKSKISDIIELDHDSIDHYVFLVNRTYVFRFPRIDKGYKKDSIEYEFLKVFTFNSSIHVPKVILEVDTKSGIQYQGYQYIVGVPFTQELAKTFTEKQLLSAASSFGTFLKYLHSFPITYARELTIKGIQNIKDFGIYFKDVLEIDKKVLSPFITHKEWAWIQKNNLTFYELTQQTTFPLSVIHAELLPKHILVDKKKINGIIDFSLRIADPANDFKYFDRYGDSFLKTVYENYLPVDYYFDQRRKFYAGDLLVIKLFSAIKREERTTNIEQRLSELRSYIHSHPF